MLIVDDNDDTRWLLARACQTANYAVGKASSGREALEKLRRRPFDVMVLDLQLPDMNGVNILENVESQYPDLITIILTANPTQESAITAVRRGAADYLCKPATVKEILRAIATRLAQRAERQKRLLEFDLLGKELIDDGPAGPFANRYSQLGQNGSESESGRLRLDPARREFELAGRDGRRVSLTASESAVIAVFIDRAGEVLSNQDLVFEAWGDKLDRAHAAGIMRPLIFRLRQKLEEEPSAPRLIRTVRGVGYVFDPN